MIGMHRFAALALLAVMAGACAAGDGATDRSTYGTPETSALPADSSGASTTPTTAQSRSASTAVSQPPNRATGPPTTVNSGATPVTEAPAPAPPPDDDRARLGPPGAYARTLLRPQPAAELTVEVIAQAGVSPRSSTVSMVERTLEDVSGKPVTVSLRTAPDAAPSGAWNEAQLVEFADRNARVAPAPARATIRFLAVKNEFGPDPNAIGVAVRGDVFAIFVEAVNAAGSPLVDAATIEQAVAVHEVGHLLGLVDIALDRNRDDPEHPFHSRNRGSVMFWAIETDLVGQVLGGPPPRSFDRDDLNDLVALRGGA